MAYSTTSRELDHEHDGRRDRDRICARNWVPNLDAIRAAFVRTIWTLTRGVSDPARRACADPDAREAGSLTPLSASHPLFCGRPGRQKAPADRDTDIGASIGSCEASQPRSTVGRRSTVSRRRHHGDGRWGWWPAGHRSPSSAPLAVRLVTRTIATRGWRAETRHTPSRRLQRRSRYDPREAERPHGAQ